MSMLMTIRETAETLGVCEKTVWNLTRRGELRAVRIGRAVRFDRRDVEAFITAAKAPVPTAVQPEWSRI